MSVRVIAGDCRTALQALPDRTVHCLLTSPPYYGLRAYLPDGHADKPLELGLETSPDAYVAELVGVFREAKRVLRDDGTLWLNLGDSYANDGKWGGSTGGKHGGALHGPSGIGRGKRLTGLKPKDLIGIPWMVAFALRADGWYLRQDNIWQKPSCMPESVTDRTTRSHEYVFMFSKRSSYFYDAEAVSEPAVTFGRQKTDGMSPKLRAKQELGHISKSTGCDAPYKYERRNRRSVWTIATEPNSLAHFAIMPSALAEICIKAGCPVGGTVLDLFAGVGTTGLVADRLGRDAILIELSETNAAMARDRIKGDAGLFAEVSAL